MKTRLYIGILMLMMALSVSAQEFTVKPLRETNEITASQYPRMDANNGKCRREDLPLIGDAYLLMVSTNPQTVTAILTPEQNGTRRNAETNATDSINNYKGYFCMWVRMK